MFRTVYIMAANGRQAGEVANALHYRFGEWVPVPYVSMLFGAAKDATLVVDETAMERPDYQEALDFAKARGLRMVAVSVI